ncbi:M28 family peptidase [Desertivirga arenae]|uniref:M28 family peptidase n=1 Tax=Desertivirga arenae TaxID=2810309 RepID=UPI001A95C04C|nr:M28 family peptidase [Pedobacter sp. SYSU D00823]
MNIRYIIPFILVLSFCFKNSRPQQLLLDVKELSSDKYEGRKAGTEGSRKAAGYIIERFKEIGLQRVNNSWKQEFKLNGSKKGAFPGINVMGSIPGKRKDLIIVSAHYDHLGKINGAIYNGADDNASGVAGLLAMATYFKNNPPEFTLLFVCFDAEESGLQGSKTFVSTPPVPLNLVALNINLDMISRADNKKIFVCGTHHFPYLKKYVTNNNKGEVKLLAGHDDPRLGRDDWTNQSDHYSFYQKHIPFLYFGVEDHPDYHRYTDDYEKIDRETFSNTSELLTKTVADLDKKLSLQKTFREKLIMEK